MLISQADIESWVGTTIDAGRTAAVSQAIGSAQAWIARQAGMRSLEKESSPPIAYLDSDNADNGTDLWLPPEIRPFYHVGTDLMTVTVDGGAMTIASGYSSSADILIRGAQSLSPGMLYRPSWGSSSGKLNVAVTCKVGFGAVGSANLAVPEDVRILIMEVSWLLFTMPSSMGRSSVSKAGTSQSFDEKLSPQGMATLEMLKGVQ